ncbi:MAG: chemotaxis protein CheW [Negativicutes bacterium]|nr:chemotaxis protein CheW [Negativicutes bacterium]
MTQSSDLLNEFIQEAKTHIGEVEAGLLRMETGDCDDETIHGVFRAVHSIKGTAGFFELGKIVELSHAMESLFGKVRDKEIQVTPGMIDALLAATDVLKDLISRPTEEAVCDIAPHVGAVGSFLPKAAKPTPVQAASGVSAWDLWNQLTELESQAATDTEEPLPTGTGPMTAPTATIVPAAPASVLTAAPAANQDEPGRRANGKARAAGMGESVRVGVEMLDDLLNIVGEMVLRRNQLLRITQNAGREVPQLDAVAQGIDNLTTNLQEKVMKTRMQPIANVFNKFPRIVRELARKMDKEVELIMQGMTVELDRSIIEALADPLTHLVRNALDHGIESPQRRIAGNKSPTGTVVLHAYHESGRVIIDIRDDGAGIDVERIRAKAVLNGWISDTEAAQMREADILKFIMRPGFSTAERVTDISGRGVGMDVVKTNIEKLGGKVEILSETGAGTTFRLILPLTLAIIPAFIVEVAGEAFVIPQANVKELVLIQPGDKKEKRVEFIQASPVLRLRDQLLPLVRLASILKTECEDNYPYFADENQTFRILVIKSGALSYGLTVDGVYDTEEILVKPVPAALSGCGCYSGVTVLGDGRIAMIIEPEGLKAKADLCRVDNAKEPIVVQSAEANRLKEQQYLLLFKCSGGELLGVDLAMVARVEEVALTRIQKIGSKQYFSFQGKTVRMIRPEHYLPIGKRKNNSLAKVYVILPKLVKNPIGIVAEEIVDAVLTDIQLDTGGISGKGIIGCTLMGDTIVTLVDIPGLIEKAAPEYCVRGSGGTSKTAPEYSEAGAGPKKAVILLAEDTPFFARTTRSYLESDGYEVILAENGREALEMLSRQTVDLVISDIEMPLMNGIELVRAIRASESLKHLPVIALTSLTGEGNKEKGLRAGFDLYEFKLDRVRLLERVNEVLKQRV